MIEGQQVGTFQSCWKVVPVLLPLPVFSLYDYRLPFGFESSVGCYVEVPVRSRRMWGVVWGEPKVVPAGRGNLRDLIRASPLPPMSEATRRFIDRTASYTMSTQGQVLRMALYPPALSSQTDEIRQQHYQLAPDIQPARLSATQLRVLQRITLGRIYAAAELLEHTGCNRRTLNSLLKLGVLVPAAEPAAASGLGQADRFTLSADQDRAADFLKANAEAGKFSRTLLDGVPGSGKTEVYFETIAHNLAADQQSLVLLPEIALAGQWLERCTRRFGLHPHQWHSGLTPAQRRVNWCSIATGQAKIIVGARSALFLPYRNLGTIVVDEEHDSSFKQEERIRYHARDMAVERARIGDFPVVLVSATPSLESLTNVRRGRYQHVRLPSRHGEAALPQIRLLDLRQEQLPPNRWLSQTLREMLKATLAKGEQAMLFLNRRGYAPLTLCRGCGLRLSCPDCSAWLVEHRTRRRLHCHHCTYSIALLSCCPHCGKDGLLAACGPGVERIAEEVSLSFPEARCRIMDSGTSFDQTIDTLERVRQGQVDVLIGTQVIAKGHHFPGLTLVGVVDADMGLYGGDLRACERTFQLLYQVAGRAGRGGLTGWVVLQSFMPEHPVMQSLASGQREQFLAQEAQERRYMGWPPYGRLLAVIVSGKCPRAVQALAAELGKNAPRSKDVEVLGPALAPLSRLRGHHRQRLLMKSAASVPLQDLAHKWLASVKPGCSTRIQVDVDPISFS